MIIFIIGTAINGFTIEKLIFDFITKNKKGAYMDKRKLEIRKVFEFEAAHLLINHPGKCKYLHGHSYKLAVTVTGNIDEESGMVMDFGTLKRVVNTEIIEEFDHKFLNDQFTELPTAENMVYLIWDKLEKAGLNLSKIELWETSGSCAILSKR